MNARMSILQLTLATVVLSLAHSSVVPKITGPASTANDYRWTAWIKDGDGNFKCGASLIDVNWVLTAASCVQGLSQGEFLRVVLGDYIPSVENEQQTIRSCNIKINKNYNGIAANDVAMMQLERPANIGRSNIEVVPEVAKSTIDISTLKQSDCFLTGFNKEQLSEARKAVPIKVKNPSKCAGLANFDEAQHVCYFADAGAPCPGDTGFPISCKINNVWTQIGVQFTTSCVTGFQYATWTYANRRFISDTLPLLSTEPCTQPKPDLGCGPAGKAFTISYVRPDPITSRPTLYITSMVDTIVTLQPGAEVAKYFFRTSYPVTAQHGLVIHLPDILNRHDNGISTNSLRIVSSDDLYVVAGYEPDAIGSTQIFPEECLASFTSSYLPVGYASGFGGLSELIIAAIADNTVVDISAPQARQVTLNQGQIYRLDVDGTGLQVTGTKPLAVFSGIACGNIKDGTVNYCDTMYEQIQPESTLQKAHIVPALKPRQNIYLRILAAKDATAVVVANANTDATYTLNRLQFKDVEGLNTDAIIVTSDNAVIMGQFGYGGTQDTLNLGDPSFVITPALNEFVTFHSTFAPATSGFVSAAIMILESDDPTGLRLNGMAVSGSKGNTAVNVVGYGAYRILYEDLRFGCNKISHVNGKKFGVVQYNQQYYRETAHAAKRLYTLEK